MKETEVIFCVKVCEGGEEAGVKTQLTFHNANPLHLAILYTEVACLLRKLEKNIDANPNRNGEKAKSDEPNRIEFD